MIRHKSLNETWLKAAVIGSLWASVEVVAGSFLHNLQIPFSGTILTAFAIFLLTAFSRLWKQNGIVWRAGVICALMKSISPSAVILGPMVGILTEAFLFEAMVLVLGRNLVGYLAGGAVAATSAILHKFFTLLILYGFDFVRILEALYYYSVKQLNISNIHPLDLVLLLVVLYILLGMIAVFLGFVAGNNFLKKLDTSRSGTTIQIRSENRLFGISEKQKYAVLLLLAHLVLLFGILGLLNFNHIRTAGGMSVIYLAFCVFRYPTALRRFKKISIWIQFLIIGFTAILVWDIIGMDHSVEETGLVVGMKMIGRAMLLIVGFSAISVELKNPLVKTVLYKRGLANLYQSLTLAFSVLPDLISSLSKSKWSMLNPNFLVAHLLRTAQELIQLFSKEQDELPVIFLITGEVGSGKTTFARNVIHSLQNERIHCGGFFSVADQEEAQRSGFSLVDVGTDESVVLCETTEREGWKQTGRYFFNPEAFDFGHAILDPLMLRGIDLIVIDELGPLELKSQGWSQSVERLCSQLSVPQLWVVRKSLVHKMARKWQIGDLYIFELGIDSVKEVERTILSCLNKDNQSNSLP